MDDRRRKTARVRVGSETTTAGIQNDEQGSVGSRQKHHDVSPWPWPSSVIVWCNRFMVKLSLVNVSTARQIVAVVCTIDCRGREE